MQKQLEDKLTLVNFRDLGGLEVANGKKIKSNLIYRTTMFNPTTPTDFKYIENMHLDSVLDLRSPGEAQEQKDILPDGVEYIDACVFNGGKFKDMAPTKRTRTMMLFMSRKKVDELYSLMIELYAHMPYVKEAFSKIFKCMDEHKTFAFHCTSGKDRTGVAAMLIELTFGRTYEQVVDQYLHSNDARKEYNEQLMKKINKIPTAQFRKDFAKYSLGVHKELIDSAYNSIFSKYDTFKDFLKDVYGITDEQIKDWEDYYLE